MRGFHNSSLNRILNSQKCKKNDLKIYETWTHQVHFVVFVARVLGEAKKRKISTKGEDLLLLVPTAAEDLTIAKGKETAEAGEQPTTTSREGDFSISTFTCHNRR